MENGGREEKGGRHLVFHGCFPICCYHFPPPSPLPFRSHVPSLPPVVVVHYARRKGRRRGKNGKREKKMEKEVPVSLCSVGKEEERQVAPAYLLECLAANERRGRVR